MTKAIPFLQSTTRSKEIAIWMSFAARLAFALTVILIPFRYRFVIASRPSPPIYGDFTDFLIFMSDLTLIATIVFWSLSLILNPHPVKTGPASLSIPLIGVMIASLISTFGSVDPSLSLYHFIRLILLSGFYLYIVNEIQSLDQLAVPLAILVLVQALVGVSQALSQRSLGLHWLGEWDLDPAWSGVSVVWADGVRALRSYGLTDHPNILGGSLVLGLILFAGWIIQSDARKTWLAISIFSLGLVAVFLTFSRSAWLALIIGCLIFVEGLRRARHSRALKNWLALAAAGLIIVIPFVWQNAGYLGVRLNVGDSFTQVTIEQRSISERRVLNDAANQLFAENPIYGVGLGAYPIALQAENPDVPYNYQPPHIALLEAAVETGLFGALAYFLVLVLPWVAIWINRRRIAFSTTFIAATSALAVITIIGLFDYYPWLLMPGRLWQILIWGLWGSVYMHSITKAKHV